MMPIARSPRLNFAAWGICFALMGCSSQRVETNLDECKLESLKAFGHLREKNVFGVFWPPTKLEMDCFYICMKIKGFHPDKTYEEMHYPKGITSGDGIMYVIYSDSEYWERDYGRLLPFDLPW
jgi:hypothetical protein